MVGPADVGDTTPDVGAGELTGAAPAAVGGGEPTGPALAVVGAGTLAGAALVVGAVVWGTRVVGATGAGDRNERRCRCTEGSA